MCPWAEIPTDAGTTFYFYSKQGVLALPVPLENNPDYRISHVTIVELWKVISYQPKSSKDSERRNSNNSLIE